jgi:methionyl aminopeptidase
MINMGKARVVTEEDGWTIRTADNLPSAHYEHSVAITKSGVEILSSFDGLEDIIKYIKS